MTWKDANMTCIILRGTGNDVQGFVRLEELPAGLQVTVHAEGLPPEQTLRVLLLSSGEEGAALDLGQTAVTPEGVIRFTSLHAPIDLTLWDAAALAEDWPSGRLAAAGWLVTPSGPVWRLADAAAQFLRVPAGEKRQQK